MLLSSPGDPTRGDECAPRENIEEVTNDRGTAWRPALSERADAAVETRVYPFVADEQFGIKHVGLSPAFEK
ncbi:MAG: hypothetical protein QXG03_03560 [Halalkalicoccus sp.]